jgi:hypothetical protein
MADHPVEECMETANDLIRQGHTIYQKFTCDKCQSRQTMPDENVFYASGKCEECGHITDIEAKGCNYMAILKVRR